MSTLAQAALIWIKQRWSTVRSRRALSRTLDSLLIRCPAFPFLANELRDSVRRHSEALVAAERDAFRDDFRDMLARRPGRAEQKSVAADDEPRLLEVAFPGGVLLSHGLSMPVATSRYQGDEAFGGPKPITR